MEIWVLREDLLFLLLHMRLKWSFGALIIKLQNIYNIAYFKKMHFFLPALSLTLTPCLSPINKANNINNYQLLKITVYMR